MIILHAYRIVSLLWIITPHRDQKAFAVQLLPKIFPFTLFFPPCLKWNLYGNFFFVMQNHLLKGMGMLDGIKKTQPVFQLWMKGIFNISQPLAAQPHHGCEEEPNTKQKSKLHCCGAEFHPAGDLSCIWMGFRSSGDSRVVPSCWDELGCA